VRNSGSIGSGVSRGGGALRSAPLGAGRRDMEAELRGADACQLDDLNPLSGPIGYRLAEEVYFTVTRRNTARLAAS